MNQTTARSQEENSWVRSLLFIAVWLLWLVLPVLALTALPGNAAGLLRMPVTHGSGLLWLLACYLVLRRWQFINPSPWTQRPSACACWTGAAAVAIIYLTGFAALKLSGSEQEPFMANLFVGASAVEIVAILLMGIVVAPLEEEMGFRLFLLGAFPVARGRSWAIFAVVVTSLLFIAPHMQYRYATTFMVLFAVGVVFAVARINTKGLLLPIALHGESALLALLLSKIY